MPEERMPPEGRGPRTLTLVPTVPFSFDQSLAFLRDFTPTSGEQVEAGDSFAKAVMLRGRAYGFRVTGSGSVERPALDCKLYSADAIDPEALEYLRDRIGFFLSIHDDLAAFYDRAKGDRAFSKVVRRFHGHKMVKFLTPFENACWAVLSQRIPMARARRMKETLVREFGGTVKVDGRELSAFPDPATLRRAGKDGLEKAVQNRRKAEYLNSVADAFDGADESWLRTGAYDEVYDWLTSIRGIGEWSANFVMLRSLGRMERLSEVGARLIEAVRKVYGSAEGELNEPRVRELAVRYGPFQGYWAYYLRINSEFPPGSKREGPPGSWMST